MAKVLLVEDDNNLREIYEARLQAEGYETATASDGEQALVVAKEAKPDLVISDVMMPKISGFEMLDILRNTDGLKDVKVIMLTALGQAEDKTRADQLGADKYLVKSQVTLEDIVKTAHLLLDDAPAPAVEAAPVPTPNVEPVAPTATAAPAPSPIVDSAAPASTSDEAQAMQSQIDSFVAEPVAQSVADPAPVAAPAAPIATPVAAPAPATPTAQDTTAHDDQVMAAAVDSLADAAGAQRPSEVTAVEVAPAPVAAQPVASDAPTTAPAHDPVTSVSGSDDDDDSDSNTPSHKKVIAPITDGTNAKPDLDKLLALEEAAEQAAAQPPAPEPTPEAAPDPALQVSPELATALAAEEAATPAPAAAPAPAAGTAAPQPSNPNQPHPNDIAL